MTIGANHWVVAAQSSPPLPPSSAEPDRQLSAKKPLSFRFPRKN